ncbi:hypothetical protein Zmor_008920 [Zophobas morio]|uniref:Charged multivesicular body protein 1b n=1 Tax=Zophobas morio TaxID=2755281 RepID=A0AA38LZF7_9CUCU|nr:hypothetical protein Zmor_008920 [Zophobas morio]
MERLAIKAEKSQKTEEAKIKKSIQQGNNDGARIYAENSIRKKNEALNYHRMASRLDAVSQRVQTALTMKSATKSMTTAVRGMNAALESMDLQKITAIMDKFESQFEDLDVQTRVMDSSMAGMNALSTPEDQVDMLINKVADQHGLELSHELDASAVGSAMPSLSSEEDAKLMEKLKELRNLDE